MKYLLYILYLSLVILCNIWGIVEGSNDGLSTIPQNYDIEMSKMNIQNIMEESTFLNMTYFSMCMLGPVPFM